MEMMSANDAAEAAKLVARDLRPLKRSEFQKLADEGCFDDERVELLFGLVVEMTPPHPSHDESVYRVARLLSLALGERAKVRTQSSFAARDDSEPVPDVVVAPNESYWNDHPSHALLVVEVSRSSIRKDSGPKAYLYGTCAVDEYWIVNHRGRCVDVYRDPHEGRWRSHVAYGRGELASPLGFPDVKLPIDELLPPEGLALPPDDDESIGE
jgi:Uma2 family endonuclease